MSNAPEPDRSAGESGSEPAGERSADPGEERTESYPLVPHDAETETVVITTSDNDAAVTQPKRSANAVSPRPASTPRRPR